MFRSDKLTSESWSKFRKYRSQQMLFDVTIIIDEIKFLAHKLILSACSEYFETMFTSNFRESQQAEIILKDISPKAFSIILDYCYNESITLDSDNAQDILAVSSILQMTDVQLFCADYIRTKINTTNCLGILNTAHQYNLAELADIVLKFTLDRFEQVVDDPESEFAILDVDWLTKLIQHDQLNVEDEIITFKAVMKWVSLGEGDERLQYIDSLIPHIRFPLMEPKALVNLKKIADDLTLTNYLLASEKYRDLVDEAKDFHLLKHCYPFDRSRFVGDRYRYRIPSRILDQRIFAVGGWTNEYKPIASVERYHPYENVWEEVSPMSSPRCGVGVAILGYSLYAVGGHDGQNYLKSVERYSIEDDTWNKDVADMRSERTSVGVVVLDEYIYAIGGQANSSNGSSSISSLADVERYDPRKNKWEECAKLLERRLGAGVTVLDGHIYVVGGADQRPTNTVECYDPSTDKWSYVAPMRVCRKHLGCTSYNGKIYAVGGRDTSSELNSAECYDPKEGVWKDIPPMSERRSGIGLVELDGLLYAVGGHNGDERLTLVECYDPTIALWGEKEPLNQERLGGGLAVLSKLKYDIP